MAMYSPPPVDEPARPQEDAAPHSREQIRPAPVPEQTASTAPMPLTAKERVPPVAPPETGAREDGRTAAAGRLNIRVQVPFAGGPFDDPDAAERIIAEVLGRGLATMVHESESSASFVWEGRVSRRRHLTLDIETDAAQEPAVREVLARLHPDRRPAILVTAAA